MRISQWHTMLISGMLLTSLCACQNTLEGIGADMQSNGKLLSEYSKNLKKKTNV